MTPFEMQSFAVAFTDPHRANPNASNWGDEPSVHNILGAVPRRRLVSQHCHQSCAPWFRMLREASRRARLRVVVVSVVGVA